MNHAPTVTILMATYNGGRYIGQQLDSLLAQSYKNWKLIIRDDGSDDNTVEIVKTYISDYSNISLLVNTRGQRGACSNFSALFSIAKAAEETEYIMFCDQDDIWKPSKIQRSLQAMLGQENLHKNEPVLIYGDLEFMDENGNILDGSLKLKHKIELRTLISFNYVYGCTLMLNRAMITAVSEIPKDIVNHDYWIALVASLYNSYFLNEKLIRYRRHSNNISGNVIGNNRWSQRIRRHLVSPDREVTHFRSHINTLRLFYHRYGVNLTEIEHQLLINFLNSFSENRLAVCYTMLSHRIFRKGFLQSLAAFYHVIFFYNKIKPATL